MAVTQNTATEQVTSPEESICCPKSSSGAFQKCYKYGDALPFTGACCPSREWQASAAGARWQACGLLQWAKSGPVMRGPPALTPMLTHLLIQLINGTPLTMHAAPAKRVSHAPSACLQGAASDTMRVGVCVSCLSGAHVPSCRAAKCLVGQGNWDCCNPDTEACKTVTGVTYGSCCSTTSEAARLATQLTPSG